jgi:hypothetical protein
MVIHWSDKDEREATAMVVSKEREKMGNHY